MAVLDDLVPEPLHLWNGDLLARLRQEGKGESLFFEFKERFDGHDMEKSVCAFANSLGGFPMLGVAANADNRVEHFPGLDPGQDYLRLAADWVVGHVSPLPTWNSVAVDSPDNPGKPVVVTRVEQSNRTPHLLASSGTIYVRVPAGSQPLRDKATLDALVERGEDGVAIAAGRAERLVREAPGRDLLAPDGHPYWIEIAVVPSPPLPEGAMAYLLSRSGRERAATIFLASELHDLRPRGIHEDRVHLVGGYQAGARGTDGSLYLRRGSPGSYVAVPTVVRLVEAMLESAANQTPAVHQVVVVVRLSGLAGRRLSDREDGGAAPFREPPESEWTWISEVGTHPGARTEVAAAVGRRLWRWVGDERGFEPDS